MVFRRLLDAFARRQPDDGRSADEIEALIESLRAQPAEDRRGANVSLTDLGTNEAFVPTLVRSTRDGDAYIRESAASALGHYPLDTLRQAREALLSALRHDTEPAVRAAAAEALTACAARCESQLRAALGDTSPEVRSKAVTSLLAAGTPAAIDAVARQLRTDPHADVRCAALYVLGRQRDMRWLDAFVTAFDDAHEDVRAEAVYQAYDSLRNDEAKGLLLPSYIRLASDPSPRVRENACEAMRFAAPEATPVLTRALADEVPAVRLTALIGLGSQRATEAVDAIDRLMRTDPDDEVRCAAASALGDIRSEASIERLARIDTLAAGSARLRAARLEALGDTKSPTALPLLCAALRDTSADVRRGASHGLWLLSAFGELSPDDVAGALPTLCEAALAPDEEVREDVVKALGNFKHIAALPTLLKLASQRQERPREQAYNAIAQLKGDGVEDALLKGLRDRSASVREVCAEGLSLLRPLVRWQELPAHLANPRLDVAVRAHLAEALANVEASAAQAALLAVLNDDDSLVRKSICQALQTLGEPKFLPPLMGLLKDEDDDVRAQAALAIAAIDDPRGFKPLKQLRSKEKSHLVRRRVVWALSFFPADQCLPELTASLGDADEHVRAQAVRALGEICSLDELSYLLDELPRRTPPDVREALAEVIESRSGDEDDDGQALPRAHRHVRMGTVHYE